MKSADVVFASGEWELHGALHLPDGDGPFPAVLWSHGSERSPVPTDELAHFYTSAGYALFTPHRRGHGRSPGEYAFAADPGGIEAVLELFEAHLADTLAAFEWLCRRPEIDPGRVALSGVSHGAIQTLLAAEGGAGSGHVVFAPAAIGWAGNPPLQERLARATQGAAAPLFLLQAENDYDLGPSERLGPLIEAKGAPSRVRVYPPYGTSTQEGHAGFGMRGTNVWGAEVLEFLAALRPSAIPA